MATTNNDSGSFSIGFTVGFLSGVALYFFTKTKEGKEIGKSFAEEWHQVKDSLIEEGEISIGGHDIADYLNIFRQKIAEFVYDEDGTKQKKTYKKRSGNKRKFFKGV
jgi:hypothetical protein